MDFPGLVPVRADFLFAADFFAVDFFAVDFLAAGLRLVLLLGIAFEAVFAGFSEDAAALPFLS